MSACLDVRLIMYERLFKFNIELRLNLLKARNPLQLFE